MALPDAGDRTPSMHPAQPVAKRGPIRRLSATLLYPRWVRSHFILAPFWLLTVMGLLLSVPVFLAGFFIYTLPNLSYIDSPSESQAVTAVTAGDSCSLGRGTGTRYHIETAPLPDGRGAGGSFSSCDSDAPATVGSTLTVYVRSDGSQRLRINVDTITDDVEDTAYVAGAAAAFGVLMSLLNVFRLLHRRRKKAPLSPGQLMLRAAKKDHSYRGQWLAADLEYRIANGLPPSDQLMPAILPPGPPPGHLPPEYGPPVYDRVFGPQQLTSAVTGRPTGPPPHA